MITISQVHRIEWSNLSLICYRNWWNYHKGYWIFMWMCLVLALVLNFVSKLLTVLLILIRLLAYDLFYVLDNRFLYIIYLILIHKIIRKIWIWKIWKLGDQQGRCSLQVDMEYYNKIIMDFQLHSKIISIAYV